VASATGTRLSTDIQPRAGQCTVWEIDPKHTLVEFGVKHMMFTTVKGRFTGVRGTISCADEADAARASISASTDARAASTRARSNVMRTCARPSSWTRSVSQS
jgi:polyisoprenoid-binding protein YceI